MEVYPRRISSSLSWSTFFLSCTIYMIEWLDQVTKIQKGMGKIIRSMPCYNHNPTEFAGLDCVMLTNTCNCLKYLDRLCKAVTVFLGLSSALGSMEAGHCLSKQGKSHDIGCTQRWRRLSMNLAIHVSKPSGGRRIVVMFVQHARSYRPI